MFYSSVSDEAARYGGYNPEFAKKVWEKRRAEKAAKEKAEAAEKRRLMAEAARATLERIAAEQRAKAEARQAADQLRMAAQQERRAEYEREQLEARRAVGAGVPYTVIERRACKVFGVTLTDLRSERRSRHIAFARQFVMYWAVRLTKLSTPAIGRRLGGRDHTTILSGRDAYPGKRAKMGRYLRPLR